MTYVTYDVKAIVDNVVRLVLPGNGTDTAGAGVQKPALAVIVA